MTQLQGKQVSAASTLNALRGMSEPLAFTFNVLDKGNALLVHAVIFTSYEVADGDRTIKLAAPENDPRMSEFVNYCLKNYAKEGKERLQNSLREIEKEIEDRKRFLKEVDQQIRQLEKEAKKCQTTTLPDGGQE